ncbi:NAD(P)/FAD-dependent oxidoreductase [Pseudooceanicola nanhaiensis]|uniref:NAD(P)/FAD-dependent oxidoreductase n=1 Tax=Pseudooceanicola nanhaiensis TaxID=375761 RepID=UPI001CD3914E|nr:FAD-dependent oxidoreductase [Pseudooceanicola nanhaiensis]MCA0922487.1 FAD-dependent oxidoreductase [Pseudooceanicola nanhaiensis]
MKADVTVIGAGVIGAQTAVQLAERGLKVVLVDPGPPGGEQAATYGNAAWLSSHSVTPPASPGVWKQVPKWLRDPLGPLSLRPAYLPKVLPWLLRYLAAGSSEAKLRQIAVELRTLLKDAPQLHAEMAARAGVPELINATSGLMHVYRDRAGYEADGLGWRIRRDLGITCEEIEAEELARRQPDLAKEYGFAVNVPEAGQCLNPGAYCAALVAYAGTMGARQIAARATGLRVEGSKLVAVETSQGDISCGSAVIAMGARSATLAAKAGDRVPLESERGYHVTVEGGANLPGPTTSVMVGDRKVVVTRLSTGIRCAGQVEIASPDASPDWRRAEIMRTHLGAVFPGLDTSDAKVWLGLRPSTPDGKPVIAKASGAEGVVHCFGHGHVGLVSSARSGRLAAQLVTGETPEIDLTPFAAARFS